MEDRKAQTFNALSLMRVIYRAQRGDADAFEHIYKLHCKRVYALCLRMVRDTNDAEDLTQEAFLQLFRKIQTFRGESAFSTWLYRVTTNAVFMHFRKKRPTSTSLDDLCRSHEDPCVPCDAFGVPDVRLTEMPDRLDLQMAIAQLPKSYKRTFILHDVEGYEHHKIAEILGCSVGCSKSTLHRARRRLRRILEGLQNFMPASSH